MNAVACGLVALAAAHCAPVARGGAPPQGRGATSRPAPAPRPKPDYEAHVKALRARLPHDGFHIVVEPPFVVVGDEAPATVKRRAKGTVRWAVDLLKKDFFEDDPDHIIDVWLFKDEKSYQKHTRQLFKTVPTTPYGFYSPRHKALIMDIHTGGGTLVHEIVHPFVAANFPDCPAWFNEGLGSLYEQCRQVDGRITGLPNWRLAGLQEALREGTVPSFAELCATTEAEFYGADRGTNYAQARYLLYYLQEKKLLRRYYKAFHAARREDPTGYRTLMQVLGRTDAAAMRAFEEEWAAAVLKLRFG